MTGGCQEADKATQNAVAETDPKIQAQIRRTVSALDDGGVAGASDELRRLEEIAGDNSRLVEQVALFVTSATGEESMTAHLIFHPCIHTVDVDDASIVRGLAPFVDSEDRTLREFVEDEFTHIDGLDTPWLTNPVSPPNYGAYKKFIASSLRGGEPIPPAFSAFIYRRSPPAALLAFYYAHEKPRQKQILWSAHVVSDAIWKKEQGFDKAFQQATPEAIAQLEKLSKDEAWWARLYVAEILHQHPEFGTPELVERLKSDERALVREAITRRLREALKKQRPPNLPPVDADLAPPSPREPARF
ncbi:MAG: hypothetical protein KY475_03015 [Planctomycetes bacterium]|nr:hypothetical protein [Planctomycetota bacterium]